MLRGFLRSVLEGVLGLGPYASLLIALVLLAAVWGSMQFMDGADGAALAGAFIGASAVFLGTWIEKWNELAVV
jgi:hypothetical protein